MTGCFNLGPNNVLLVNGGRILGVSWGGVSLYFSPRPDWYLTLSPLVVFYRKFGDIGDHARAPYDIFILFH